MVIMAGVVPNQVPEPKGVVSDRSRSAPPRPAGSEIDKLLKETPRSEPPPVPEIEQLRGENVLLRDTVSELEKLLEEKLQAEEGWSQLQKEHEALLEEKSEVIRELHLKLQERLAPAIAPSAAPPSAVPREPTAAPREEELLALSEELENERRQLKEDEEALMAQMREMEVQMSRERAELARQRNDLQRLHSEIRHELELATRHGALRERLLPLQRRHQEMLHPEQPREGPSPTAAGTAVVPAHEGPSLSDAPPRDGSGLFRRLFG
jgi:hypothetical protein